jgi:hypothetical protein
MRNNRPVTSVIPNHNFSYDFEGRATIALEIQARARAFGVDVYGVRADIGKRGETNLTMQSRCSENCFVFETSYVARVRSLTDWGVLSGLSSLRFDENIGENLPTTVWFASTSGIRTTCPHRLTPVDSFTTRVDTDSWTNERTITITGYTGTDRDVVIPSTINGIPVTIIGHGAFSGNQGITSVIIPSTVTRIDSEAFRGCTRLATVTIPSSVTRIGNSAFNNCTALTSVVIPNSVTNIDDWAFRGCTRLASVTIPNSVTDIRHGAFYDTALTAVTIPDSVNTIGDSAFGFNASGRVGGFTIHASSQSAGHRFSLENGLGFGTSPSAGFTTHINVNSWTGEWELTLASYFATTTTVTIPHEIHGIPVTIIGRGAFHGNQGITSVIIPSTVTRIDSEAFRGCTRLNSVTIPNSVTHIGVNAFSGCTALTSVVIPNSVTNIDDWAFRGCTRLASVTIPNSVTDIRHGAFYDTALTAVTIPDSVNTIGDSAFGFNASGRVGNFTIRGSRDSAAHRYATEHGFTFTAG